MSRGKCRSATSIRPSSSHGSDSPNQHIHATSIPLPSSTSSRWLSGSIPAASVQLPSSPGAEDPARSLVESRFQIRSQSRSQSRSSHASTSSSSQPDPLEEKVTLDTLVKNLNLFVQALDNVVSLRISAQQKREALKRSRAEVSHKDETIANAIRKSHVQGALLDQHEFLQLTNDSLRARDELGVFEVDFDTVDYRLVPKEDDLLDKGEDIKRQLQELKSAISQKMDTNSPSVRSSDSRQTKNKDVIPNSALAAEQKPAQNVGNGHQQVAGQSSKLQHWTRDKLTKQSKSQMRPTQSEPVALDFAPDLTPGKSWSDIDYCSEGTPPKSVKEEDLPGIANMKADFSQEGIGLFLGNRDTDRSSLLENLSSNPQQYGRRVSSWLLCRLRTSRLEVLRLRGIIDDELEKLRLRGVLKKGTEDQWKWTDILDLWSHDDAALSNTPQGSVNPYNTTRPE